MKAQIPRPLARAVLALLVLSAAVFCWRLAHGALLARGAMVEKTDRRSPAPHR
jgi:hypothetical protein